MRKIKIKRRSCDERGESNTENNGKWGKRKSFRVSVLHMMR